MPDRAQYFRRFGIPVLVGVVVFALAIGFDYLAPTHLGWMAQTDRAQHVLGLNFFVREPWALPPGKFVEYGGGFASSIVYTDSIPLFALPLKAVVRSTGWEPPIFQYFGAWLLLCFVLQALFASEIARRLGADERAANLVAATACLAPPFLGCFHAGAEALCAHWILLAAFWLHLRRAHWGRWTALGGIALGVHFYLFAMMLPLWALGSRDRARLAAVPVWIAVAWAFGYFVGVDPTKPSVGREGPYGATLLAFFDPAGWSHFVARHPNPTGLAYLGAGVFVLLLARGKFARALVAPGLVAVVVMLVAFSLTAHWTTGWHSIAALAVLGLVGWGRPLGILVGTIALAAAAAFALRLAPAGIVETFRFAARFAWVAWYWIFFVAIACALTSRRPLAWLGIALALQTLDLQDRFLPRPRHGPVDIFSSEALSAKLSAGLRDKKRLAVVSASAMPVGWAPLSFLALENHRAIDVAYFARRRTVAEKTHLAKREHEVATMQLDADALYLVYPDFARRLGAIPGNVSVVREGDFVLLARRP